MFLVPSPAPSQFFFSVSLSLLFFLCIFLYLSVFLCNSLFRISMSLCLTLCISTSFFISLYISVFSRYLIAICISFYLTVSNILICISLYISVYLSLYLISICISQYLSLYISASLCISLSLFFSYIFFSLSPVGSLSSFSLTDAIFFFVLLRLVTYEIVMLNDVYINGSH